MSVSRDEALAGGAARALGVAGHTMPLPGLAPDAQSIRTMPAAVVAAAGGAAGGSPCGYRPRSAPCRLRSAHLPSEQFHGPLTSSRHRLLSGRTPSGPSESDWRTAMSTNRRDATWEAPSSSGAFGNTAQDPTAASAGRVSAAAAPKGAVR